MTEDIDDLQRECLKPDIGQRSLFVLGQVLERKKPYMNEAQMQVQRMIEGVFHRRMQRAMGYQSRPPS